MASKTQDTLFEHFQALTTGLGNGIERVFDPEGGIAMTLQNLTASLEAAKAGSTNPPGSGAIPLVTQAANAGATPPVPAVTASSTGPSISPARSSSGVGSTVLSIASKVFESGLGLVPLISGLLGLFGGGGPSTPSPLEKYVMPERLYFTGAETGNGFGQADYDQTGMSRLYNSSSAGSRIQGSAVPAPNAAGDTGLNPISQINVSVQAMDARSFLDHSDEIAQAVRQAMLNLSSINDVVNDL